jgi:hypothetical protein
MWQYRGARQATIHHMMYRRIVIKTIPTWSIAADFKV